MKRRHKVRGGPLLLIPAIVISFAASLAFAGGVLFREDFNGLSHWEPYYFPRIKEHSTYEAITDAEGSYLAALSNSSASALIHKGGFNPMLYSRARWRWKITNVYEKGDAHTKSGDDYPMRIYVMFQYDPEKASLGERIKYGMAKRLYGRYPPHSSLNYIWANRALKERIIPNAYTEKAMMVVLRQGDGDAGRWVEEDVDILSDYREAFGADPPLKAKIAVMNDSDDTKESSASFLDYIVIYGPAP